ncbi:MAG TPA: glycosyltransferase [Anaerolineaceae bacterium]
MIYILLPAYNEERDIGQLLKRICDASVSNFPNYRVLVVNDGSTDLTLSIVTGLQDEMPLEVLDHGINKGLGKAMLTGLRRAAQIAADDDVLVTMDADNTHDPVLIGAMLQKVRDGADLVIASRYEQGGEEVGLSGVRSFLSRGASALLTIFFPIHGAKDYTCGFRAYRGAALKRVYRIYGDRLVEERGFTCMAEILIKMREVGVKVAEVPLVLRYDLKSGESKMKIARTILRYFVLISRNLFRRPALD